MSTLKVAVIGCGKIADQHAEEIANTAGCRLVAVCDQEILMAEQLRARFDVPASYTDVDAMLAESKPDIVHITTPPQSHFTLACKCLEAGSNIYVEKPFTLDAIEAEKLLDLATRSNLKVTVGHNAQFSQAASRARRLVAEGYLGGAPLHIESYYCYNLGDTGFAKALLGDAGHWVRRLPGGLLHNIISHGISKIVEYLPNDKLNVHVVGFTSPMLQSIGEHAIVDELRVIITGGPATAYFTFSTQFHPSLHMMRLYGPRNGLIVDEKQQTVLKLDGDPFKSYLEQFLPPLIQARRLAKNSLSNMWKFVNRDFHDNHGMRDLISKFYRAVDEAGEVPIPYDQILRTAQVMDDIFAGLAARTH